MATTDALVHILQEANRKLDHQVEALRHQDHRASALVTLGAATLTAGFALVNFALSQWPQSIDPAYVTTVVTGFVLNLAGIVLFVASVTKLVGKPRRFVVGPDPPWLQRKAELNRWDVRTHILSIMKSFPEWHETNDGIQRTGARLRLVGLWLLLLSFIAHATALTYLVIRVAPITGA